jgi:hypothetical protein
MHLVKQLALGFVLPAARCAAAKNTYKIKQPAFRAPVQGWESRRAKSAACVANQRFDSLRPDAAVFLKSSRETLLRFLFFY